MDTIKKVAVIGAGTMGSGIASHLTNAGVSVVLLDVVPEGANDRSVIARSAVERLRKSEARSRIAVAGRLVAAEKEAFHRLLTSDDRPFIAVLGGAKISGKIGAIENPGSN